MRHRTKIRMNDGTGRTLWVFICRDCKLEDYIRTARGNREDAVDDARAHRDAYRAIEAKLAEEERLLEEEATRLVNIIMGRESHADDVSPDAG